MKTGLWACFCIFVYVNRLILSILLLISAGRQSNAQVSADTCRFMSYNVLNFDNTGNSKEAYLRTVISSVHPDILVVQELIEVSGATRFLDSVMRPIDPLYAMADFINSYDTDNGLYYRSDAYTFLSNTAIATELRDINQFHMRHIASGIEFYVYSVHLKASSGGENAAQRKREVDSLRKATLALPDTANLIVTGDFNIYGSYEEAYMALLDSTEHGFVIDLLEDSLTSTWNNSANAEYHTQSTRLDAFGGGSTGGMDDRFDMILYSPAVLDTAGMAYLPGSFYEIGNDGDRYDKAINSPANAAVSPAVADGLYFSSDHIPVYAEFTFRYAQVPEDTTQDTLLQVIQTTGTQLRLFPNPVSDQLHFICNMPVTGYAIYGMDGRMVRSEILYPVPPQTDTSIYVADLPPAEYVLVVHTPAQTGSLLFLKK